MKAVHAENARIDWIDHARGICIVFVVLLYSTGTAESVLHTQGFIHALGDFARAFRMPDFFLISGFFVSRVIHRPWRSYLDTKVVHFLYFYILWVTIDFIVMHWRSLAGPQWLEQIFQYLSLYLQPHGQLWFIYLLPLFFLAVKLTKGLPILVVAVAAVALKLMDLDTGWKMIDRFGMYFVFFYAGHLFAHHIFALVEFMRKRVALRTVYLLVWCFSNAIFVSVDWIEIPIVNLVMGLTGALAVILIASMLPPLKTMAWLGYLGRNSIVVYVGFGVPMIFLRKVVLTSGLVTDIDLASILLTVLSILGALCLYWATRGTRFDFLFRRPAWASIAAPNHSPANPSPILDSGDATLKAKI